VSHFRRVRVKTIDDFRKFYEGELLPHLRRLETRRQHICRNLAIGFGVVAVLGVGVGSLLLRARSMTPIVIVIVVAAGLMALLWWLLTRDFVREFKNTVIHRVVAYCDPSLVYSPDGYVSQGEFVHSSLFKHSIDRYRGEDLVQGTIGQTSVKFSEVHAEYKTTTRDSKGNTRTQWHTIFKGVLFIGDFNKHFKGRTVVLPDTAQKFFGRFGQTLQKMNLSRADLVKLEDPEFERRFVVYGTDQVESRYILSTSLMRRILDFGNAIDLPLFVSFVSSSVYVAIGMRKDMFEPRIFRTLLDFDLVREYLEDIQLAVGIVEELNLNNRIWTKV